MKLQPTNFFLKQLEKSSFKTKQLIKAKLLLAKQNPTRYKRIKGYKLYLFRIRLSDNSKEIRIVYVLEKDTIKILCILDRRNEYKDLKHYLKILGYL